MDETIVEVTYLELRSAPTPIASRNATERVTEEQLSLEEYLARYRRVGAPLRWDQRLLPTEELAAILQSMLRVYVLRDLAGIAPGFCEFDRSGFPETELKNYGPVPERIWQHTDSWDHPAVDPCNHGRGPDDVRLA